MINRLTPREIDVVSLVSKGYTNKEIASKLNIKRNTVNRYLQSIYSKLGVRNRVEATILILKGEENGSRG